MAFPSHQFPLPSKNYQQIIFELTKSLFKITVPEQQSRNVEDIRRFGVYQSGVEEIDADTHNRWITVMVPLRKILDYSLNGVPIKIRDRKDIKRMYDIIQEYCYYWAHALYSQINIGDAPIDELLQYDELAEKLFYFAKYSSTSDMLVPKSIRSMLGQPSIGAGLFSQGGYRTDMDFEEIKSKDLERPSMAEFFKRQTSVIRKF